MKCLMAGWWVGSATLGRGRGRRFAQKGGEFGNSFQVTILVLLVEGVNLHIHGITLGVVED